MTPRPRHVQSARSCSFPSILGLLLVALSLLPSLFIVALADPSNLSVTWDGDASSAAPLKDGDEIPVLHTAFVQTGEELHYFSESTRFEADLFVGHRPHPKTFTSSPDSPDAAFGDSLRSDRKYHVKKFSGRESMPLDFNVSFVDFGDSPVGIAQSQKVLIRSRLSRPVILDAIVGNTVHFQSSFFDANELSSFGKTTFEIAFLPREEGRFTAQLHLYTSVGIFMFEVKGSSSSNPYHLPRVVGFRVPFNGSLAKDITIHNPYPNTLRIVEAFSSGGNAHFELAHEVDEKVAGELPQYWDIRPFQTKTIGRVRIVGASCENTTYFVQLTAKVMDSNGKSTSPPSIIRLPIPVEVTKKSGIFTTKDLLDFRTLRIGERSEPQMFSVYQSNINGGRIDFETLYVEKGDHAGIYMEFASSPPIAVLPGKHLTEPGPPSDLVKVVFDASRISFDDDSPSIKVISGSIIAVSRGGKYNISIPFRATVYQGNLKSVGNDMSIQEETKVNHKRSVRLHNRMPFDLAVWNISMTADARQYFSIRLFEKAVVLPKNEVRPVFLLKYIRKVPDTFNTATFYVYTNVSNYRVELSRYSGRLNIEVFGMDDDFNFGLVDRNQTRTIRCDVHNPNKATLTLHRLRTPNPSIYRIYKVASMKLLSSRGLDNSEAELEEIIQGTDIDIPPQHHMILDVELKAPMDGSVIAGVLVFQTEYESKAYELSYQIGTGNVIAIPEVLHFGQTYPGKVVYRTLQMFNTFDTDMTVARLSTLHNDERFYFESLDNTNSPVLRSGRLTNLGRLMFRPQLPCLPSDEDCYLGLPLHTPDGQWFVHGLTLPANLAEIDSYLYKKLRNKYDHLVATGRNKINTSIIVNTNMAKHIKIRSSAELTWPRLLTRNAVHFPLTALGNFTIVNLTLANPTSIPVAVQVIPLVIYPDAEAVVDLFREHLITPLSDTVEMNETLMFSLRDTELFTLKPDSPVPKLREEFEKIVPNNIPRFTLSMVLKPFMKIRLRLGFLPSDTHLRSSLLLIRNNLTVIEPVVVYGKGARIGMNVDGIEARSKQPLLFEILHDHLADCNNPKRLMHQLKTTLTVRRPFIVRNIGDVQFTVVNISINGVHCENRGFRILNCYPFRLPPNETYMLDVAYTPDFLTTTNEADLQLFMHMNTSAWMFPLVATVPGDMIAKCHRALPRPPFENLMYYSCVTALVFCLICVMACAYLEGDRAIGCAIRQQFAARNVFDLNNLDPKSSAEGSHGQLPNGKQREDESNSNRRRSNVPQNSQPSSLQVGADANFVMRTFIRTANAVVLGVHWVWKWSLMIRGKQSSPKPSNKKKKRAVASALKKDQVQEIEGRGDDYKENDKIEDQMVAAKVQQNSIQPPAPQNNNNNQQTSNKKQHNNAANKQNKSPKAATQPKNPPSKPVQPEKAPAPPSEQFGIRKRNEVEKKLGKTQKIMDDYSNDDASAAIQRARNAPVPTQADSPENAPEPREPAITTASYPASFNPHVTSTPAAPPLHAINPLAMPHGFMSDYAMLSNLPGLSLFGAAHLPGYQPRQSLTPQQMAAAMSLGFGATGQPSQLPGGISPAYDETLAQYMASEAFIRQQQALVALAAQGATADLANRLLHVDIDDRRMPPTPAPSLASVPPTPLASIYEQANLGSTSARQPDSFDQLTPPLPNQTRRSPSDADLSAAESETSAAPDWMDTSVNTDAANVDDDFSALVDASENIFNLSDDASRSSTPPNQSNPLQPKPNLTAKRNSTDDGSQDRRPAKQQQRRRGKRRGKSNVKTQPPTASGRQSSDSSVDPVSLKIKSFQKSMF
ncbi:hypothetical protein WR25_20128 isoform C [Diploscapter pachys]|uniref:Uncharacterized protein n=1 Tax=Diploscapter pachys TaxID=2018661 RepID=A0A2A2LZV4_9BILA|nr:hypothetical protein WR25_20128 isoform C [Diploscapter pachys]